MSFVKSTVLALAAALGLAMSSQTPAAAQEMTKLRVGYLPVGVYSYFWRARDAGYFKDENIEVELSEDWSGAATSPAAASTRYGSSLRFL